MYLFGASGHAKVIIEILEQNGISIDGIFDDNPDVTELLKYKVVLPEIHNTDFQGKLIIAIGHNATRKKITERFSFKYGNAFHPSAILSKRAKIGVGTVVMGQAIINVNSTIGDHAIINTSASIDHDCDIGDFAHISPNSTLCGHVRIGEGSHIGAGAIIIPDIKIGKWVTIGAGTVITKDIPDYSKVVGNPGRIIN
jgi:sugar O-acyltransferase (sialic acid O-acetyltransferase NeuD family)